MYLTALEMLYLICRCVTARHKLYLMSQCVIAPKKLYLISLCAAQPCPDLIKSDVLAGAASACKPSDHQIRSVFLDTQDKANVVREQTPKASEGI